eukprot:1160015-Pelagomonas_calceolata.AAC.9
MKLRAFASGMKHLLWQVSKSNATHQLHGVWLTNVVKFAQSPDTEPITDHEKEANSRTCKDIKQQHDKTELNSSKQKMRQTILHAACDESTQRSKLIPSAA